jgi:hypothetical protein
VPHDARAISRAHDIATSAASTSDTWNDRRIQKIE